MGESRCCVFIHSKKGHYMDAMTVKFSDAAKVAGCSMRYLRQLDKLGQGPAVVRFGRRKRILVDTLHSWLKQREQRAA